MIKNRLLLIISITSISLQTSCRNIEEKQLLDKHSNVGNKIVPTDFKNIDYSEISNLTIEKDTNSNNAVSGEKKLAAQAIELEKRLKSGQSLASLMSDKWSLIYHKDDRCDGSTDGSLDGLLRSQVDEIINIELFNDGNGWGCEKKDASYFDFNFSLQEQVKNWDRIEIIKYDYENKLIYLVGKGVSDYLVAHYSDINGDYLIMKLEYRSEDPG